MFSSKTAMFLYAQSPVHMGAGVAVGGIVDNPIQREAHTGYPYFAASGIKGAIRQHLTEQWQGKEPELINRIFGPDTEASDHAGALSFSDASLVAFPVQCMKNSFVYVTSPTLLAKLQRSLATIGINEDWMIEHPENGQAISVNPGLKVKNRILLDTYDYDAKMSENLKSVADWLSENAIPQDASHQFFREKIANDLVLIPDEDFSFFVQNATSVEAHVKINDKTGTAQEGALFYTENLPPESILLSTVMTSHERFSKKNKPDEPKQASIILGLVSKELEGATIQMGGDATTGRGLISVTFTGEQS